MNDISETGARLTAEEPLGGLDLREFFLLLSSVGLVYRRCRLVRFAGDQIGIEFVSLGDSTRSAASRSDMADA